jgi:hypothetical protein
MLVIMRAWPVAVIVAACGSAADKKGPETTVVRAAVAAVAAESAKAAAAAAVPSTGKWDELHLVERLVQSGLAPQALNGEKSEPWWHVPVHAYRLGTATLHAYIFADSSARRRVTDGLDSLAIAPAGTPSPYKLPHVLVVQNNLAAVLVGGTERQQERVLLALTAGLAGPSGR